MVENDHSRQIIWFINTVFFVVHSFDNRERETYYISYLKVYRKGQLQWCTLIRPAFRRLRQGDGCEFGPAWTTYEEPGSKKKFFAQK